MATPKFTSNGSKAASSATLDKTVFGLDVKNHQLLKDAYVAYLANGRENHAVTKTRGLVSGGGKKPWKQKGTGRARFGSSRVPIWRGGGITFGPTGNENYSKKLNTAAKRTAIRQALSLANQSGKISVVESFDFKGGKVKPVVALLKKIGAERTTLIVVDTKDELVERSTSNIPNVKAVQATYLNVFDILNAHHILISSASLELISDWLATEKTEKGAKS